MCKVDPTHPQPFQKLVSLYMHALPMQLMGSYLLEYLKRAKTQQMYLYFFVIIKMYPLPTHTQFVQYLN